MDKTLFIVQRITAMVLAPLVLIHLGLILFAVRGGLSGAEILSRTQSNVIWPIFYGLFVVAAAVHAPIGVRNVLREWTALSKPVVDIFVCTFALLLLLTGVRAVSAIT